MKKFCNVNKLIVILATGLLLGGCERKPKPVAWEYKTFGPMFVEPHEAENGVFWWPVVTVTRTKPGTLDGQSVKNHCDGLNAILNEAGRYGWEYAGFNGKQYLLKRPRTAFQEYSISVSGETDAELKARQRN